LIFGRLNIGVSVETPPCESKGKWFSLLLLHLFHFNFISVFVVKRDKFEREARLLKCTR
jgi:hypothetical protein